MSSNSSTGALSVAIRWYSAYGDCCANAGARASASAALPMTVRIILLLRCGRRSGDRGFGLVRVALVVQPADFDLVAFCPAAEAEAEYRIARDRLADLAFDHGRAVHVHREVLDQVRLALGQLLGRHGVRHQHAHVGVATAERSAHFHRSCHVPVLPYPPQPPIVTLISFVAT